MEQKFNTRFSTEEEVVSVEDVLSNILWEKFLIEDQGWNSEKNTLYQDNKSSILSEMNGRKSAGKGIRVINIHYFFITDQV